MMNRTIKSVTSLMSFFVQRQELQKQLAGTNRNDKVKPLPKEVMKELGELYELIYKEIYWYNRHASKADQIELPPAFVAGVIVKVPEILNASGISVLINEALEVKYVSGSRYDWSVFMYWWSSVNQRKIERLTWYKYLGNK